MKINRKKRVQLAQLNSAYGDNVFIPYTIGMLQAYVEQFEEIKKNFEFTSFLFRRENVSSIVDKIGAVEILGISCYVWCWEISIAVAQEVKRRYPDCLIIVGGPHVPDQLGDFFEQHPYLDIACHGEGEVTFSEILKEYLKDGDYKNILGLSYYNRKTNTVYTNPKRPRIVELDTIPSPYLKGVFDSLIEENSQLSWQSIWETNRGCPYRCSFCDWGSATATKIRKFSEDRLNQEIEWFSKKKISYVMGSDANFGIFKRDKELAEKMAAFKLSNGFPEKFRVCYAKNSNERVFEIAKILSDSKLAKGISISMQSLDATTLKNIKRHNIKNQKFHALQTRYNEEGIVTYTELIVGLPGETYLSFVEGMDTLIDNGQHQQINIYSCSIMPNAEMGDKEYQREHGMQTVKIPIFQGHTLPNTNQEISELDEIVVQTNTLSLKDWRKTHHYSWVIQCFHILGITQAIAIFLRYHHDIKYSIFYEAILEFGHLQPASFIGKELTTLNKVLDNVLAGIGFDQYLPGFLEVTWPSEEASFLRFSEDSSLLYREIEFIVSNLLLKKQIHFDTNILNNLLNYQHSILVNYKSNGDVELSLDYNLPDYIRGFKIGKEVQLEEGDFIYTIFDEHHLNGDKEKFAREVVWYGRKGGKFLAPIQRLHTPSIAKV